MGGLRRGVSLIFCLCVLPLASAKAQEFDPLFLSHTTSRFMDMLVALVVKKPINQVQAVAKEIGVSLFPFEPVKDSDSERQVIQLSGSMFSELRITFPFKTNPDQRVGIHFYRTVDNKLEAVLAYRFTQEGTPVKVARLEFARVSSREKMHRRISLDLEEDTTTVAVINPMPEDVSAAQCGKPVTPLPLQEGEVSVAVIDTGVDYYHPAIAARILPNFSDKGLDEDHNGFVGDYWGWDFAERDGSPYDYYNFGGDYGRHGTLVAGVIARFAPEARIIPVRYNTGNMESLAVQAKYATMRGARVVNISIGALLSSDAMAESLRREIQRHPETLFVSGAGNGDDDHPRNMDLISTTTKTLDLPNLIVVAASQKSGELSTWADYGPTSVHTAALGEDVLTATRQCEKGLATGSSFAVPQVSALAARILSRNPTLSGAQVVRWIQRSAIPLPALKGKVKWGAYVDPVRSWNRIKTRIPRPQQVLASQ